MVFKGISMKIGIFVKTSLVLALSSLPLVAQDFSLDQYKKALWMTTRFYGAQRSGEGPNWLYIGHSAGETSFTGDQTGGQNVAGGWFDCGDHVMFGQTQFFSAYMLAKAYEQFPTGHRDDYSGDYIGYRTANNYSYGNGAPNGIPDLLDELAYELDFIKKATPSTSTFIYQKGDGNADHQEWKTAPAMSRNSVDKGGEPRSILTNPNDASMASFAAATLALSARIYSPYQSQTYIDQLKAHALNAYAYAKAHPGTASAGSFYPANARWQDDFAIAALEMYATFGDAMYLSDANNVKGQVDYHYWALNYNNNDDLAFFNFGTIAGDAASLNRLNQTQNGSQFLGDYFSPGNINAEGVTTKGDNQWGALRYPANIAFVAALYSKAANNNTYRQQIYNQIDYILGSNNAKQSFVVGFCEGCNASPQHPHHRGVFLDNTNTQNKQGLAIPARNAQLGALVGGSLISGNYQDNIESYQNTEVCTDYNAGLVGALGYIVANLDPGYVPPTPTSLGNTPKQYRVKAHLENSVWYFEGLPGEPLHLEILDLQGRLIHQSQDIKIVRWDSNSEKGVHLARVRSKLGEKTFRLIPTGI
jgi:hypothetical protein